MRKHDHIKKSFIYFESTHGISRTTIRSIKGRMQFASPPRFYFGYSLLIFFLNLKTWFGLFVNKSVFAPFFVKKNMVNI